MELVGNEDVEARSYEGFSFVAVHGWFNLPDKFPGGCGQALVLMGAYLQEQNMVTKSRMKSQTVICQCGFV